MKKVLPSKDERSSFGDFVNPVKGGTLGEMETYAGPLLRPVLVRNIIFVLPAVRDGPRIPTTVVRDAEICRRADDAVFSHPVLVKKGSFKNISHDSISFYTSHLYCKWCSSTHLNRFKPFFLLFSHKITT